MRKQLSWTALLTSCLLLTGCWDHSELPEFGFVQALALDLSEEDEEKITLTTQFIKPSPKIGSAGGGGDKAYVNIETTGDTVFEAIRDIATHLGRKAQWSHTRIILVGEDLAKKRDIGELLEFFYRDHEPRMMISIAFMEGQAKDFLESKPFIENTISQQLKEIEYSSFKYNSKTLDVDLLNFGRDLKSETKTAKAPHFKFAPTGEPIVSGIAYVQDGKLAGHFTPSQTESLLKLINKTESGIIEVPCDGSKSTLKESVEISELNTSIDSSLKGDRDVSVKVSMRVFADIGELKCTDIHTTEKIKQYNKKVAHHLEKKISSTIEKMQGKKVDLIGLGNQIYRKHPKEWKKMKEDWPEIFSRAKFDVNVHVDIGNSGADIGKPFFE